MKITVPGADRSWEEQLRGLTARKQSVYHLITMHNVYKATLKKEKLNLQNLRAHFDVVEMFLKVEVKMVDILKPTKKRTNYVLNYFSNL